MGHVEKEDQAQESGVVQRKKGHQHPYPPWYSRPRIMGPVPFQKDIANSVRGPQFLAPDRLLLHSTAPRRSPT